MSYCRFGEGSDVYLYGSVHGGFDCCACLLDSREPLKTRQDAMAHLEAHRKAGHDVPEFAFKRLRREIAERKEGEGE